MKRNSIAAISLLMAITCGSPESRAAGENLIPNGSFDTDFAGWQTYTNGGGIVEWSPDDADGATGSGSVEINTNLSLRPAALTSACVPIVGGNAYVFSVAQKHAIAAYADDARVGVSLLWGCDSSPGLSRISRGNQDWTTTNQIVSAPANATMARVRLGAFSTSYLTTGEVSDFRVVANFDNIFLAAACEGACGDAVPDVTDHSSGDATTSLVTSSDALYILKGAVGDETCPGCICDVNDSGDITAVDSLLTLAASVGGPVPLVCPQ